MHDKHVQSDTYVSDPPAAPAAGIPPQVARPPLRIPRSKTAAMLLIQQLVVRGHAYWTRGAVCTDRLPAFVQKMDQKFAVCEPAKSRTRMRTRGVPTGHLIVYRQPQTDRWLWWLLVAGRDAAISRLAGEHREILFPVHDRDTALRWANDYELRCGPRGTMTWWLCRKAANDVEAELRHLASAHGRAGERIDDLCRAVTRARNRPMFAGVRQQVGDALRKSAARWYRTHRGQDWPAEDGTLPWIGRGVRLYDDPPAVITPAG